MKCSIISDLHIKKSTDAGYKVILDFLRHPLVKSSDKVYLLGDVFDLMCGDHPEYFKLYEDYFSALKELLKGGVEVYYVEGNHDLHLGKLYQRFFREYGFNGSNFHLVKGAIHEEINGKKVYLSHGDEIQQGNWGYKIYKTLIHSAPLSHVANKIVPLSLLDLLGTKASKISRKNGSQKFDFIAVRDNFRIGSILKAQNGYEIIICGHSHIKDDFVLSDVKKEFRYLNNGQAAETKCFIHLDQDRAEFISLN